MYFIGYEFFRLYLSYKKPKLFRVRGSKDKEWHLSIFLTNYQGNNSFACNCGSKTAFFNFGVILLRILA